MEKVTKEDILISTCGFHMHLHLHTRAHKHVLPHTQIICSMNELMWLQIMPKALCRLLVYIPQAEADLGWLEFLESHCHGSTNLNIPLAISS